MFCTIFFFAPSFALSCTAAAVRVLGDVGVQVAVAQRQKYYRPQPGESGEGAEALAAGGQGKGEAKAKPKNVMSSFTICTLKAFAGGSSAILQPYLPTW